jgi:hypothetical protein
VIIAASEAVSLLVKPDLKENLVLSHIKVISIYSINFDVSSGETSHSMI